MSLLDFFNIVSIDFEGGNLSVNCVFSYLQLLDLLHYAFFFSLQLIGHRRDYSYFQHSFSVL